MRQLIVLSLTLLLSLTVSCGDGKDQDKSNSGSGSEIDVEAMKQRILDEAIKFGDKLCATRGACFPDQFPSSEVVQCKQNLREVEPKIIFGGLYEGEPTDPKKCLAPQLEARTRCIDTILAMPDKDLCNSLTNVPGYVGGTASTDYNVRAIPGCESPTNLPGCLIITNTVSAPARQ